nr:RNA dependent RNA protein [Glossina morsitans morsitans negevirus]
MSQYNQVNDESSIYSDSITNNLLSLSELSKFVKLDYDELTTKLSQTVLASNSTFAAQYTSCITDAIRDKLMIYTNLKENIFINQRLTEDQKNRLLKHFSPPFRLNFSHNPTDFGAHMYYRALNEIATYACYHNLNCAGESVPSGYGVLIKEVGANVSKIVNYERDNVHACTPNLSMDDAMRITSTVYSLQHKVHYGQTRKIKMLARRFLTSSTKYRCYTKSQYCQVKAKYVVFAHSLYDISLTDLANIMDSADAVKGSGFIHYSKKILSNLHKGSDEGLNWELFSRKSSTELFIKFWFDDDYQSSYVHNLKTYMNIITQSVCKSTSGKSYVIQRNQESGGLLFFTVMRSVVPIEAGILYRQLPYANTDNIIIHYYKIQDDPKKYRYNTIIPIRLVVPKKFFERLYFYLQTLPEGKFVVSNAVQIAATMSSRVIINGTFASSPYDMEIDTIQNVAYATYFLVYCQRYNLMTVLSTLKNDIDKSRHLTIWNKICRGFKRITSCISGNKLSEFVMERTVEDVIKNAKVQDELYRVQEHATVLSWFRSLFDGPEYFVRYFPMTKVVSIEEDIEYMEDFVGNIPYLKSVNPLLTDEEIDACILQHLKINRVDSLLCHLRKDHECVEPLREIPNYYTAHCVYRCMAATLNISMDHLKKLLLASKFFLELHKTTQNILSAEMLSGFVSEYSIFEIYALEFGVNVCIHYDDTCENYYIGSVLTKHFKISDGHCTELRPKFKDHLFAIHPYYDSYDSLTVPDDYEHVLTQAYSSPDKHKVWQHRLEPEQKIPYVCRSFIKLFEIDSTYNVFSPNGSVFDVSSAPGSWIQYVNLNYPGVKVIHSCYTGEGALNLLYNSPENYLLQNTNGDVACWDTFCVMLEELVHCFDPDASDTFACIDTVMSDAAVMRPNSDEIDLESHVYILHNIFTFMPVYLKDGGNAVVKSFIGIVFTPEVVHQMSLFESVDFVKPLTSNPISTEYYIVCRGYKKNGPENRPPLNVDGVEIHFKRRVYEFSKKIINKQFFDSVHVVTPNNFYINNEKVAGTSLQSEHLQIPQPVEVASPIVEEIAVEELPAIVDSVDEHSDSWSTISADTVSQSNLLDTSSEYQSVETLVEEELPDESTIIFQFKLSMFEQKLKDLFEETKFPPPLTEKPENVLFTKESQIESVFHFLRVNLVYDNLSSDTFVIETKLYNRPESVYDGYKYFILYINVAKLPYMKYNKHFEYLFTYISYRAVRVCFDFTALPFVDLVSILSFFKLYPHLYLSTKVTRQFYDNLLNFTFVETPKYEASVVEYTNYQWVLYYNKINEYKIQYDRFVRVADMKHKTKQYLANLFILPENFSIYKRVPTVNKKHGQVQISHPSSRDEYSYGFDGVDFLPIQDIPVGKYYMVGEYSRVVNFKHITHALQNCQFNPARVSVNLVHGIAGHGKTTEIVSKHNNSTDLVLSATVSGRLEIISRTCKKNNIQEVSLDLDGYRTIASFLCRAASDLYKSRPAVKSYTNLFIDEVMMVHSSLVIAAIYYSGCTRAYLYGDTCQIPAHSELPMIDFKYASPTSVFDITEVRHISHRIPCDVVAALNTTYVAQHQLMGHDNLEPRTTLKVLKSMECVHISSIDNVPFTDGWTYLTFTKTAANDLNKKNQKFGAVTIASYQGCESDNIAIVRTSYNIAEKIYMSKYICVTALTRHKRKLVYYTMCSSDDTLASMIICGNAYPENQLKNFSVNYSVGSITYISNFNFQSSKFFVSRDKFTNKFVLLYPEHYQSVTHLVLSLKHYTGKDIFVKKNFFKKFDQNSILKSMKKLNVKLPCIYVKVQNQPFSDNFDVLSLVNDYMAFNCIPHLNAETLENVFDDLIEEMPPVCNFIDVTPSVPMLQVFFNHLYPQQAYVNTSFDAYFVHHENISYVLNDLSLSLNCDRFVYPTFDNLRPVLSTSCPNVRFVTQREIILGLQKRNLNPPELMENVSHETACNELFSNFVQHALIPGSELILREMDSITPTVTSITSWLERQDRTVLKLLESDLPLMLSDLSSCSLSLKRNPKIVIKDDAISVYSSVQTITFHPKFINAYFCSIIDAAQDRLLKLLQPYIKFNTKMNIPDFGKVCSHAYRKYGKLLLFSGDDSLLINSKFVCKEMDFSKFDKSQLEFALLYLMKLLNFLGVPPFITSLYYQSMIYRSCKDSFNKVTCYLTPQMESGSAATYFGNTVFCAAAIFSCLDTVTFSYTPKQEKFSQFFNLEVKEFDFKFPYFCSKFVIYDGYDIFFLPDPIKLLIKLGRKDLVNYKHLEEFRISMLDLISQYGNYFDLHILGLAIIERYHFPYDPFEHIRNLISTIRCPESFKSLFFHTQNDRIDFARFNFSKDY